MDCKLRAKNCGGCPLLGLDYAAQLKQKEEKVRALVGKYGPVHPIRGMEQPYHYRNKVISTFATGWGGKLTSGIYAANSHKVLPVESCLLQDEVLDKTMQAVRAAANACRYQPYDEDKGTGLVRHCLLRRGVATGQVMVVLVTASPIFPARSRFVSLLRERHPEITTIVMNCNPKKTSMVLGEQERILYGKGYIEDILCEKRFAISPRSFYQVNPVQTEKLYSLALSYAGLTGRETVWDLYCGIGTISLFLAQKAGKVYGVEIVPENVKYPQGAEKMQIKAITNREVKPGGLPSGVGCNVISTQTAYAIYRACYEGMPSIERVLTVAGSAMGDKSYNLQCRFGTPFSYIVEQCGGFVVEPKKIVLGGPMMGLIATNLEAPNIKGTAGILFFTDKEDRSVETPTCIHCGKCLTVCPMKLEPLYMYKYFQNRDFENMQKYHILDCFECGSCSYNCPGRLPLTHTFKTAKLLFAARAAEEKARAEAAAKEAETK